MRNNKLTTCEQCGVQFNADRPGRSRRFCSSRCWYKAHTREPKLCKQCGCEVGLYSKLCLKCWRETARRKPKTCLQCGASFSGRGGKFCSNKCVGAHNRVTSLTHTCSNCEKIFTAVRARTRQGKHTFCSRECQHKFFKEHRHPAWRGERRHERGKDWPTASAAARARDNNICVNCDCEDGKRISVDHIVPYRLAKLWSPQPNALVNLACMCRSCHSKKTGIERRLLEGDIHGFITSMYTLGGINYYRVLDALKYFGLERVIEERLHYID